MGVGVLEHFGVTDGTVVLRVRSLLIVGSLGAVVTVLGVVSLLFSHLLGL
jgi:hypothetical protein